VPNITDPWIEANCKNLGYFSLSEYLEYMNNHKLCMYIFVPSKTRPHHSIWGWNIEAAEYFGESADGSDLLLADEKRPGRPWFETNPHRRGRDHSFHIMRAWEETDLEKYPGAKKWAIMFGDGWSPRNIYVNVIVPSIPIPPDYAKIWSKRTEDTAIDLYFQNWKKPPRGNIGLRDRSLDDLDPTIRAHSFSMIHSEKIKNNLGLLAYVS